MKIFVQWSLGQLLQIEDCVRRVLQDGSLQQVAFVQMPRSFWVLLNEQ